MPAQLLLKQVTECQEARVRLCAGKKFDQKIDVAVGAAFIAQHRTEQSQPLDTHRADLRLNGCQSFNYLPVRQRVHLSPTTNLPLWLTAVTAIPPAFATLMLDLC